MEYLDDRSTVLLFSFFNVSQCLSQRLRPQMEQIDASKKMWTPRASYSRNPLPDTCLKNISYEVIKRIGSKSMNAQVFEIKTFIDSARLALKIFRDTPNDQEHIFAMYLGSKYPMCFPRVVSSEICQHVKLDKSGMSYIFVEEEESYFRKKLAFEETKELKGLDRRSERALQLNLTALTTNGDRLLEDFRDVGVPDDVIKKVSIYEGTRMRIMASELLSGDLSQMIEDDPLNTNIVRLVSDVFEALLVLLDEGICHGDLHTGNVLIRENDDGTLRAVIHDFGTTFYTEGNVIDNIKDALNFIYALGKQLPSSFEKILKSHSNLLELLFEVPSEKSKVLQVFNIILESFRNF